MTKNDKTTIKDTGERMIPEYHYGSLIYAEHFTRYQSVKDLVKNKVVLDIASGSGYGTNVIADTAKYVYGVDISGEAVDYAKDKYKTKNVEFILGDCENIPLAENLVDVVVTFETIEHIKDYKKFINEIHRVLKPDGIAIISTPNKMEFVENNHFHLHEFKEKELTDLLLRTFSELKKYYQATYKLVAIGDKDLFTKVGNKKVEFENLSPINVDQSLYFYFICSNRKINEAISPIAAAGGYYSDKLIEQQINKVDILNETVYIKNQEISVYKEKLLAINNSSSYKMSLKLSKAKNAIKKALFFRKS